MPTTHSVPRHTASFEENQISGNLVVSAPFAGTFTISVGGKAAIPYALSAGGAIAVAINNSTVKVVNTTPEVLHPPAGDLLLHW